MPAYEISLMIHENFPLTRKGGWIKFVPFPVVPNDYIVIQLEMPTGTSLERTAIASQQIQDALDEVLADLAAKGVGDVDKNLSVSLGGNQGFDQRTIGAASNRGVFVLELTKSEERAVSAVDIADDWREAIGTIPGVKSMQVISTAALNDEKPINVQLEGGSFENLLSARTEISDILRTYEGVFDVTDNYSAGKLELQMSVKPEAKLLGVTAAELGVQIRQAFYGAEAERVVRGRDEIKVMVRYPREERNSLADLENLRIRLTNGNEVAFGEVANVKFDEGYPTIKRVDQQRVVNMGNASRSNQGKQRQDAALHAEDYTNAAGCSIYVMVRAMGRTATTTCRA